MIFFQTDITKTDSTQLLRLASNGKISYLFVSNLKVYTRSKKAFFFLSKIVGKVPTPVIDC